MGTGNILLGVPYPIQMGVAILLLLHATETGLSSGHVCNFSVFFFFFYIIMGAQSYRH